MFMKLRIFMDCILFDLTYMASLRSRCARYLMAALSLAQQKLVIIQRLEMC